MIESKADELALLEMRSPVELKINNRLVLKMNASLQVIRFFLLTRCDIDSENLLKHAHHKQCSQQLRPIGLAHRNGLRAIEDKSRSKIDAEIFAVVENVTIDKRLSCAERGLIAEEKIAHTVMNKSFVVDGETLRVMTLRAVHDNRAGIAQCVEIALLLNRRVIGVELAVLNHRDDEKTFAAQPSNLRCN